MLAGTGQNLCQVLTKKNKSIVTLKGMINVVCIHMVANFEETGGKRKEQF